ncbi:hypothetical protein HDU96_003084, partial [Phlyctochytrium bullatum]
MAQNTASSSQVSVQVFSASTTSTNTATPSTTTDPPLAAIAGGIVGALLLTTICIALFVLHKRRQAQRLANLQKDLAPPQASLDRPLASRNTSAPGAASLPDAGKPAVALFTGLTDLQRGDSQRHARAEFSTAKDPSRTVSGSEKPAGDLFTGLKEFQTDIQLSEELQPLPGPSSAPIPAASTSSPKPGEHVDQRRGKQIAPPERETIAAIPQTSGGMGGGISAERTARSRIAALTPAEVGEELLRMGVGPNLVSALEGVNGMELLALTNADLLTMGIQEWYSRDLLLRTISNMESSEQERLEQMATTSGRGDELPTYT